MIDFSTRMKAYKHAPEFIQEFYHSADTGAMLRRVFSKYQLPEDIYDEYVAVVSSVILGFHHTSELPQQLMNVGIGQVKAPQVASDLVEFLTPVMEYYDTHAAEQPSPTPDTPAPAAPAETPAPTPAAVTEEEDLPPTEEPTYQSSQEDIFPQQRTNNGTIFNPPTN